MSKIARVLLLVLVLAACEPSGEKPKQAEVGYIGNSVYRYVDKEAGVVCWRICSGGCGIDCLPINETELVIP